MADSRNQALRKAKGYTIEAPSFLYNILDDISKDEYQAIFLELRTLHLSFKHALSALGEAIARFAEVCLHVETRSFNPPLTLLTKSSSETHNPGTVMPICRCQSRNLNLAIVVKICRCRWIRKW